MWHSARSGPRGTGSANSGSRACLQDIPEPDCRGRSCASQGLLRHHRSSSGPTESGRAPCTRSEPVHRHPLRSSPTSAWLALASSSVRAASEAALSALNHHSVCSGWVTTQTRWPGAATGSRARGAPAEGGAQVDLDLTGLRFSGGRNGPPGSPLALASTEMSPL